MKMTILITVILILSLLLCACGTSGTITGDEAQAFVDDIIADAEKIAKDAGIDDVDLGDSDYTGMENPMTEHASLKEINEIVGSALVRPPVAGITGERYFTIDCGDYTIADYRFIANGNSYTFRSSPVADRDISGIYVGEGTAFADEPGAEATEYRIEDGIKAARWFTMDGQYVLIADEPDKMDEETFKNITGELYSLTGTGMSDSEYEAFYAELAGNYADRVSQRATAEVTANGSESVTVVVSWANGAACRNEWTMTAKLSEDGLLYYNDLVEKELTYTTDTDFTEEVLEFPAEGWFEYADGILFWSGSGEDDCNTCEFEKLITVE